MDDAGSTVLRLLGGYMVTQALGVVVESGLADAVQDEPVPVDTLADRTGIPAASLTRLLRALRTVGVFDTTGAGVVHTSASRLLRSHDDASMAAQVRLHLDRGYTAWTGLEQSLREGGSAFERQWGVPVFEWLASHPEQARIFDEAMAAGSRTRRRVLLGRDWSAATHVVDLGGGTGTNLLAVLETHPHLHGTVVDLPHVEDPARRLIGASPAADRCGFVAGSFFDAVPEADTYVMSAVLHDWDDGDAGRILRTCRSGAPDGARLVLVETVLEESGVWDWGVWMDLHMLVMLDGRERTEGEWRRLLDGAGWVVESVAPGLVEAVAGPS